MPSLLASLTPLSVTDMVDSLDCRHQAYANVLRSSNRPHIASHLIDGLRPWPTETP